MSDIKWIEVERWLIGNFEGIEISPADQRSTGTYRHIVWRKDRGKQLSAEFVVRDAPEGGRSNRQVSKAAVAKGSWRLDIDASPVLGRDWKRTYPKD